MKDKLKWYIVDKEYVSYLKEFDNKVENIDYSNRFKPYLGIIITINEINYYVPISSVKEKHYKMNEDIDFIKISENDRILGVLNLNNMIPIDNDSVKNLKYSEIEKYRNFKTNKEKSLYISLLNMELELINSRIEKIKANAFKLYKKKPIDLIQKFRKDVVILKCWKKNVENIKEILKNNCILLLFMVKWTS